MRCVNNILFIIHFVVLFCFLRKDKQRHISREAFKMKIQTVKLGKRSQPMRTPTQVGIYLKLEISLNLITPPQVKIMELSDFYKYTFSVYLDSL